eukprot:gene7855-biopygen8222
MLVGTKDGDRDSEDATLGEDDVSSVGIIAGYVDGVGELTGDDDGVLAGEALDEPSLFMEGVFEGLSVHEITGALIGFDDLGNTSMEVGAIVVGSEEGTPEGSDDGIEVFVLKNTGDLCQNGVGGIVEISDGAEYGDPEGGLWSSEQRIELMLDLLKAPLLGHWSSPSQQRVIRTQRLSTEIQKGR